MASPAIAVQDLRVDRGGREVLHGVSLAVPRGRVVGLLGPSGCGKTTLMRSILGVQMVRGGTVTVLGEPAGSRSLRARVGYSPQSPAIYADLTVWENLSYFASILKAPKGDAARVVREAGLDAVASQVVGTLSGGELSRASLAVALLADPEVLVLDEPTVGLDPVLLNALLGTALGLFCSAFARTEFQAVQFMPVVVIPQIFLGGILVPRDQMATVLEWISNVLPMSYAIEAMREAVTTAEPGSVFWRDVAVVAGSAILALGLGAATLRRRTP